MAQFFNDSLSGLRGKHKEKIFLRTDKDEQYVVHRLEIYLCLEYFGWIDTFFFRNYSTHSSIMISLFIADYYFLMAVQYSFHDKLP